MISFIRLHHGAISTHLRERAKELLRAVSRSTVSLEAPWREETSRQVRRRL